MEDLRVEKRTLLKEIEEMVTMGESVYKEEVSGKVMRRRMTREVEHHQVFSY